MSDRGSLALAGLPRLDRRAFGRLRRATGANPSDALFRRQPAVVDCRSQGLVVALVHVGIGLCEVGEGTVEPVAAAQVGGDRDPVA